jgi:hypothetical protein
MKASCAADVKIKLDTISHIRGHFTQYEAFTGRLGKDCGTLMNGEQRNTVATQTISKILVSILSF